MNNDAKTMFSLAMAAYAGIIAGETTLSKLRSGSKNIIMELLRNETIIRDIGKWDLIWGPAVYAYALTHPDEYHEDSNVLADNLVFIAQKQDTNVYVLSIMGTNPSSTYGWLLEDINVCNTLPWAEVVSAPATSGVISQASKTGLDILNEVKDGPRGTTIIEFLGEILQKGGSFDLYITGHSLGAALAVTYAAYLNDTRGHWTADSDVTLYVYPYAGATVGNMEFKNHIEECLNDKFQFPERYWNKYDIIPHAWNRSTLAEIPYLYKDTLVSIPPSYDVFCIADFLGQISRATNYIHVRENSRPLSLDDWEELAVVILREIEKTIIDWLKKQKKWEEKSPGILETVFFFARASFEHVISYFILLDAEDIMWAVVDVILGVWFSSFSSAINRLGQIDIKVSAADKDKILPELKSHLAYIAEH